MFGRSKIGSSDIHPFTECPFLLVSGMGRSGTTVLRNCIAAHPEVDCLNQESNYLYHLLRGANLYIENEFGKRNLVVKENTFWEMHQQFILNLLWPGKASTARPPKALATYCKLDPRAAAGMAECFPKLSICFIVRNGIEVVSSYRAFDNFKHISFEEVCRIWEFHAQITQYVVDQSHCFLVRHEWLMDDVTKFEETLTNTFQQVGLPFHRSCLEILSKRYHPTSYSGESKSDRSQPAKRKERWKFWSEPERQTFTDICGPTMNQLEYEMPWRS